MNKGIIHPLFIDSVAVPYHGGVIGMTVCPGRKGDRHFSGFWDRNLDADLLAIRNWGAESLVTLIEPEEFQTFEVLDLPEKAAIFQLDWIHLPLSTAAIPDERFDAGWERHGSHLLRLLRMGKRIVIHCGDGTARTGLVAVRLLMESGVLWDDAVRMVRATRSGAFQGELSEGYIGNGSGESSPRPMGPAGRVPVKAGGVMDYFDEYYRMVLAEVSSMIQRDWRGVSDAALEDATEFLELLRGDLARWTRMLSVRALTRKDLEWLLLAKCELAEFRELKSRGVPKAERNRFLSDILRLMVATAAKSCL